MHGQFRRFFICQAQLEWDVFKFAVAFAVFVETLQISRRNIDILPQGFDDILHLALNAAGDDFQRKHGIVFCQRYAVDIYDFAADGRSRN